MNTFLFLHSFIYLHRNAGSYLLFNPCNRKKLIINDEAIFKILKKIEKNKGSYIGCKLNSSELNNLQISCFIKDLKKFMFGDTVQLKKEELPVQIAEEYRIDDYGPSDEEYAEKYRKWLQGIGKKTAILSLFETKMGNKIIEKLSDLTIYYNCHHTERFKNAGYQHLFPMFCASGIPDNSISFGIYKAWFKDIVSHIRNVNIVFGDADQYFIDNISDFANFFSANTNIRFYTFLSSYDKLPDEIKEKKESCFYLWTESVKDARCSDTSNVAYFHLVENEEDVGSANKHANPDAENFFIIPYFNGKNLDFCRKMLSFKYSELIESELDKRKFAINKILNLNKFGHLVILPDGDVYSDINKRSIGNIKSSTVKDLLFSEMTTHRNWFQNRRSVSPCQKCLFVDMCPPITDIETYMGKYNFCSHFMKL